MSGEPVLVKAFMLNQKEWIVLGIGNLYFFCDEETEQTTLKVQIESNNSIILESKIESNIKYNRLSNTLITWAGPSELTLCLSFKSDTDCDDILNKIRQYQSTVSVNNLSSSDDSEDEELVVGWPPCERRSLKSLNDLIRKSFSSKCRMEEVAKVLKDGNYIKKLLQIFTILEAQRDHVELWNLFEIFKNMILLDKIILFEIMFSSDLMYDVIGILEYDPSEAIHKRHREYLKHDSCYNEVFPFEDPVVVQRIKQTYCMEYIRDVILKPLPFDEEHELPIFNCCIASNKMEIVLLIKKDKNFLRGLLNILGDSKTLSQKRHNGIQVVKDLCSFSSYLSAEDKDSFIMTILDAGFVKALEDNLRNDDLEVKFILIHALYRFAKHDPLLICEAIFHEVMEKVDDWRFVKILMEQIVSNSGLDESGLLSEVLGFILNSNYINHKNLAFFYDYCMPTLITPLIAFTSSSDDMDTLQILERILNLLVSFVKQHSCLMKSYILKMNLLQNIVPLISSKHKFLALAALRLVREMINWKDGVYNDYIMSTDFFAFIFKSFEQNSGSYNLLEVAIIDLFKFIRQDSTDTLCIYLTKTYSQAFNQMKHAFCTLRLTPESP